MAGQGSETAYPDLVEDAPAMLWRSGPEDHGRVFHSAGWLAFTGREPEQARGHGWLDRVHPDDLAASLADCLAGHAAQRAYTLVYRLRRHDGAWCWVQDLGRPILRGARFCGFAGACIDITEVRQAEAERERLLAELHHRVKNNAQATTAFLGLQANRAGNAAVALALRAAATRVMLATLVQDRMFQVPAHGGIALGPELEASARSAMEAVGRPEVALDTWFREPMVVPVHRATPLALIVNELVVNAARHAFPAGQYGWVRVQLREVAPGIGELVVADNGIGLAEPPPRVTDEGRLGLHLVPRLARQAGASLRLEGAGGTRVVLRFAAG
jgi:PAS domain S-box-containing protein